MNVAYFFLVGWLWRHRYDWDQRPLIPATSMQHFDIVDTRVTAPLALIEFIQSQWFLKSSTKQALEPLWRGCFVGLLTCLNPLHSKCKLSFLANWTNLLGIVIVV